MRSKLESWVLLPPEAYQGTEVEKYFVDSEVKPKFDKPCVRLRKPFYGHPDAGICWERHCDARLRSHGFVPIFDWPSCYFHEELKFFLMVYVDDFKMSGPTKNLPKGWENVRKAGLDIEDPTKFGLFLGCAHERFKA